MEELLPLVKQLTNPEQVRERDGENNTVPVEGVAFWPRTRPSCLRREKS